MRDGVVTCVASVPNAYGGPLVTAGAPAPSGDVLPPSPAELPEDRAPPSFHDDAVPPSAAATGSVDETPLRADDASPR